MDDVKATKLIPDLGQDLINDTLLYLRKKITSSAAKPLYKYRGADVYEFGDDGVRFTVLVHNDKVVYFVRYKRVRYSGFKLGRQVLLWRDKNNDPVTGGFAQKVFFGTLLPRYGTLIADKEQTKNGAAFWSNAILGAFARGLKVYCLDRVSKVQLTELTNEQEVEAHADKLWGTTNAHHYTFAVISQKPLTVRPTSATNQVSP